MAVKVKLWVLAVGAALLLVAAVLYSRGGGMERCPGTLVHCPGVGCISGRDKCVTGSKGGPSVVFSQEPFENWPGVGVASTPPYYGEVGKEMFTATEKKTCSGNYRSDGPCLMEFPGF